MKKWIFSKIGPPREGAGDWDLTILKWGLDRDWFEGVMKKIIKIWEKLDFWWNFKKLKFGGPQKREGRIIFFKKKLLKY